MTTTIAGLPVKLIRKRNKRMYLRLSSEGQVVITAPMRMSMREIERFVVQHLDWIARQQAKLAANPHPQLRQCETGEPIWLWGTRHTLVRADSHHWKLEVQGDSVLFNAPSDADADSCREHLREWYRKELKRKAPEQLERWSLETGLNYREWRTR